MNQKYAWKEVSDKYYYYKLTTGKVVGQAGKVALQELFFATVYLQTNDGLYKPHDERQMGHFISLEHAKMAIEEFWDIQNRTLIGN